MLRDTIKVQLISYISSELLPVHPRQELENDIHFISDGVIDSLASLRLILYIEQTFGVAIKPSQVNAAHLDTVDLMADTILCNHAETLVQEDAP